MKRDTELMARRMKKPRAFDRRRMVNVIRFLKGARELGHSMQGGEGFPGKVSLDVLPDTNYAPDDPTTRAMTCGATFCGGYAVKLFRG